HVHFLRRGYDVLCRRSASSLDGLPNWTITRLEISRDEQVAYGNYSTVWRGTWQGQIVAIKELNALTDKDLFLREVEIWKPLRHENILELWGASYSRPFFLVSPYMLNANLLSFLRSEVGADAHKIRLMLGIADGMSYLHSRDVCHGDLKAKNVLISNNHVPMICDFGLSELKMDIERKSTVKPTGGTLRWTAPEVLLGQRISFASDVFAFAITICEMLAPNDIPYGYVNSQTVRAMVLNGERCQIPATAPQIKALVMKCWEHKPADRPSFENLSPTIEELLPNGDRRHTVSTVEGRDSDITSLESRDTQDTRTSYQTAGEESDLEDDEDDQAGPEEQYLISPQNISLPLEDDEESLLSESSSPSEPSVEDIDAIENDKLEKLARSYRHHLTHAFDDRFREPLWQPTACEIGDIGYLTSSGAFHTLFNAKQGPPANICLPLPIPTLQDPPTGSGLTEKTVSMRNAALRAIDSVTSLTNSVIRFVSRQNGQVEAERDIEWTYSVPLSALAQPKRAGLVIYEGKYVFLNDREPAREYLKVNAEAIPAAYGDQHRIKKEDIIIIVGGLFSTEWALMMASRDYGSTINFNVHKQRPNGEPWGTWSIVQDSRKRLETNDEANAPQTRFVTKVSKSSDTPQAVLLARLKFPTSGINRDVPTLH
ncbi:kinase-like domain-containing protein, partial [Filobasidium floriforme]